MKNIMRDIAKKAGKKVISVLLLLAIFFTSFQLSGVISEAADYTITVKKISSRKLYHNKWTSSAKFGSGGGTTTSKDTITAKLHYVNGAYGYCAYMNDSTDDGAAKKFNSDSDSRTAWVNKKKDGYPRYAYLAVAQAYMVDKKVSLSGISGSSSLLALGKTDRMLLAQAYGWYLEFAGWNRTKGAWAMAIKGVPGWSAAKQYVLFDQLTTSIRKALPEMEYSQSIYKLKKNGNDHQPILVVSASQKVQPKYDTVTYSDAGTAKQEVTVNIEKKDTATDAGLAGAEFMFYCDGTKVGTAASGEDGKVAYIYTRELKTDTYSSTKTYCTNWSKLDTAHQKIVTAKGVYQNKTKANAAAKAEVDALKNAELNALKSLTHEWKVEETKAPFGHQLSDPSTQTFTEGAAKTFSLIFMNPEDYRTVNGQKVSNIKDYGVEASLAGAVYELYAEEDILGTDNKTVIYPKGTLIATARTDKDGKFKVSDLYPGKYYLLETQAPKGFELYKEKIPVDLSDASQDVTLPEDVITGKLRIQKTYGADEEPEAGAEFEIVNSKDEVVETITAGDDGIAESGELPYGTYTVRQTVGVEGYEFLVDQNITVDGSKDVYEITANDEEAYAGIAITKTTLTNDMETGEYAKAPEAGAEFEIQDSSGNVVETIVTDETGVAKSGKLEPGTYVLHQTKGTDNFTFIKDITVTLKEGENVRKRIVATDDNSAPKIRIQKTKSRDGEKEPEEGAQFAVLDAKYTDNLSKADLSTSEKRIDYVNSLDAGALIDTLITDKDGECTGLLTGLPQGHDFVVLQVSGAAGYALADPYYSKENTPEEEGNHDVYTFTADDALEDWAKIEILKKAVTGRNGENVTTRPEPGAEFELRNQKGEVVANLTTDSRGTVATKQLDFGVYILHQTKGSDTHNLAADQRIVLNKDKKQQTVEVELVDEEKYVTVELTKKSSETQILLNHASYEIYNDAGEKVVNLTTGAGGAADGTASCKLPFGTYTLKEVQAPDGYKLSEEKTFTLDIQSVTYKDGEGSYRLNDEDEPVYGEISVTKTGDALTDFTEDTQNFQYSPEALAGAEYTLYAKEDILLDDGSVLWKAGTQIDKKTTDQNGEIRFTRTVDGKETTKFPQGVYYFKETKAPYGYTLDETEHEVVIDWDTKAEDMNDIDEEVEEPEVPGEEKAERPDATSGDYVLCQGAKLNALIQDATTVTFTWETAPDGAAVTDVSESKNGTVVLWADGTDYYVSTQKLEQEIIFNSLSNNMFANCADLEDIWFDNVDTSKAVDMCEMFSECTSLVTLDLSNFNTESVKFVTKMFYNCVSLETVYAPDSDLLYFPPQPPKEAEGMKIEPKYEFMLGTEYAVDDFVYTIRYNDGSAEEIEPPQELVTISPQTASPLGTQEAGFTFRTDLDVFDTDFSFLNGGEVKTEVQVVDSIPIEPKEVEDIKKQYDLEDELKTYSIRLRKADGEGTPVEGATFGLYALTEIVDKDGNTLFKKGDLISTAVSDTEGNEDAVVSFSGLPSNLYKKDSKADGDMYEVREIKAALGYYKTDETASFHANLDGYGNSSALVHDFTDDASLSGKTETKDGTTEIYDSVTIVNEEVPYITLHKTWEDNDDAYGNRPDSITVQVTTPDGTVKKYTLSAANDWTVVTDIPRSEYANLGYEYKEFAVDGYYKAEIDRENYQTCVVEYINRPHKSLLGSIKIKKKDDAGKALAGVEFTLYDQDGVAVETEVTDKNGVLDFVDLEVGEYTVKETKTIPGYSLLSEPIKVTIPLILTEEEVKEQSADKSKAVEVEGNYYFYDQTYEVSNSAVLVLPKTGRKGIYLLFPAGFGIVLLGLFTKRKKGGVSGTILDTIERSGK